MSRGSHGSNSPSPSKSPSASPYAGLKAQTTVNGDAWEQVEGMVLIKALQGVTDRGDLISFSRTSDQGAICICIMAGVEKHRMYAASPEELAAWVESISEIK